MRPETSCAVAAASAAGVILAQRINAETIVHKGELDIATGTDLAAEDMIREVLQRDFPGYAIIGEERGGEPPAAGAPYWLVDPLCGTQTFACRIPAFCTNIALVEEGRVSVSAVFDGASNEVYAAERGGGAHARRADRWEALLAKDGSVLAFELAGKPMFSGSASALGTLFGRLVSARRWHVRMLGTTLPFARVATGEFAGLFLMGRVSSPLHTAAGCLLAEEAGAVVTNPKGKPWNVDTKEFVVAATRELHNEFLGLYRQSFE